MDFKEARIKLAEASKLLMAAGEIACVDTERAKDFIYNALNMITELEWEITLNEAYYHTTRRYDRLG